MNIARDYANNVDLELAGWKVIRVWECDIKTKVKREKTLENLYNRITGSSDIGYYQSSNGKDNESIAAEPNMQYGELKDSLTEKGRN